MTCCLVQVPIHAKSGPGGSATTFGSVLKDNVRPATGAGVNACTTSAVRRTPERVRAQAVPRRPCVAAHMFQKPSLSGLTTIQILEILLFTTSNE